MKCKESEYYFVTRLIRRMSMGEDRGLLEELRTRIQELENKVEALRISRRVLMNLIDTLEKEKREQVQRLENQNERLQKNNSRYAQIIMHRNAHIKELEMKLRQLLLAKNKTSHSST